MEVAHRLAGIEAADSLDPFVARLGYSFMAREERLTELDHAGKERSPWARAANNHDMRRGGRG